MVNVYSVYEAEHCDDRLATDWSVFTMSGLRQSRVRTSRRSAESRMPQSLLVRVGVSAKGHPI